MSFPPIGQNEIWKIGWVQACTRMKFHNIYGTYGYSSWEFPTLSSGKVPMISDSDGKNFPWYGGKSEVSLLKGPQTFHTRHKIIMNDNFNPHVTWDVPFSNEKNFKLTCVKRNQRFYTWLVAMNVLTGSMIILRTFKWSIRVEIHVDPNKEFGKRAQLKGKKFQQQPILVKNKKIPHCALYPGNANSSQILTWIPKNGKPILVVSSKTYHNSNFKNCKTNLC